MFKTFIAVIGFSVSVFANNYDPVPRSEVLILKHTSKLENYNWAPIYAPQILGSLCGTSKRDMCAAQTYANTYTQNIKNLRAGFSLPVQADYPALIQSIWAVENTNISVDDVWKTLMSYLKLQRSMTDLRDFLGESSSNSRTTVFRGSVYPHLEATAANFSVFHRVQGFQQGLEVAGGEPVLKIQLNRTRAILKKAFDPFMQQLSQVKLDMSQPQVDSGNVNALRVRQIFSMALLFDVIQMNLRTYNVRELTVLETIDSYESLPAHFYLYALFLKENQNRMIQTLDPQQLKLMFNLVLLADLVKYNSDASHFDIEPVELTEESSKLVSLVQKEISTTLSSYHEMIAAGVVP